MGQILAERMAGHVGIVHKAGLEMRLVLRFPVGAARIRTSATVRR